MEMRDYIQRFKGNGSTPEALVGVLRNIFSGVSLAVEANEKHTNARIFAALDEAARKFDEFFHSVDGRFGDGKKIHPDAFRRYLASRAPEIYGAWTQHRQEQPVGQ